MKITNLKSGIPYQLKPGTQLEVERTNPFFNEYGEQTTPLELPDTDQNRIALGYPDQLGSNNKPADISVLIEDGDYYAVCKQAILSAKRKESISTSFYMNQGSFYSSLQKTDLKTVFEGETIPGISTVEQGISFCRSLRYNTHDNFAIFPVLIKNDADTDNNSSGYKYINRWGHWNYDREGKKTNFLDGSDKDSDNNFYNAESHKETIDNTEINIPEGYYMSPFIRAYYVLQRIFHYFGYTLLDNFFSRTHPFNKMVFINNVADTLVNGTIMLSHLVPDVKCNDILNLFRHKFCCEFIANEVAKTVSVELFSDVLASGPEFDLTPCLIGNYTVEYPEKYKQIKLVSKYETDHEVTETFESLSLLVNKYPLARFNQCEGVFMKIGFNARSSDDIKLTEASAPYYAGGSYETQEIEVEECVPDFRSPDKRNTQKKFLFIGDYQMLNSKIIKDTKNQNFTGEESDQTVSSSNMKLYPILAFPFINSSGDASGTIADHDYEIHGSARTGTYRTEKRIFDYSLCYQGETGIFEKFYRPLDTLLRNSLHTVRADLLLSKTQKRLLPAHKKYILCNQAVFLNKLSFLIGGESEPKESELLTLKLYKPATSSPYFSDMIVNWNTGYYWKPYFESSTITEEEYNSSLYPKKTSIADQNGRTVIVYDTIYPSPPTAEDVGKDKCYETKFVLKSIGRDNNPYYSLVSQYLIAIPEE